MYILILAYMQHIIYQASAFKQGHTIRSYSLPLPNEAMYIHAV